MCAGYRLGTAQENYGRHHLLEKDAEVHIRVMRGTAQFRLVPTM